LTVLDIRCFFVHHRNPSSQLTGAAMCVHIRSGRIGQMPAPARSPPPPPGYHVDVQTIVRIVDSRFIAPLCRALHLKAKGSLTTSRLKSTIDSAAHVFRVSYWCEIPNQSLQRCRAPHRRARPQFLPARFINNVGPFAIQVHGFLLCCASSQHSSLCRSRTARASLWCSGVRRAWFLSRS
jgi:hypothetical protein